jgi:hypothetical protein
VIQISEAHAIEAENQYHRRLERNFAIIARKSQHSESLK